MTADGLPGKIGRPVTATAPCWPRREEASAKKPELWWLPCDDIGFADLGCCGSSLCRPASDALAAHDDALAQGARAPQPMP